MSIHLDPSPGFVVKTRIVDGPADHVYLTKVFLNICHDEQVPKPEGSFDLVAIFPKIVLNEWEIPIIVSPEKRTVDKKGVPAFVYDCCINNECFQWIMVSKELHEILIEWALEAVELLHSLVLERNYLLPKMASKGELSATEVSQEDIAGGISKKLQDLKRVETLALLDELEDTRAESSDTPLPDLMNIGGTKGKPLIEEIEEMSIEDDEKETKDKSVTRIEDITEQHAVVPYEFTVNHTYGKGALCVIFTSEQLTQKIQILYLEASGTLTLQNHDPTRRLGPANLFELPLPQNYQPVKAFCVEKAHKLYVKCAAAT